MSSAVAYGDAALGASAPARQKGAGTQRQIPIARNLTVTDVAARKKISVRQVRRDIAAGRLEVTHDRRGRVLVSAKACEAYRSTSQFAADELLPVDKAAKALGLTETSMRNAISMGRYPSIRIGGRRFVVTTRPSPALRMLREVKSDGTGIGSHTGASGANSQACGLATGSP